MDLGTLAMVFVARLRSDLLEHSLYRGLFLDRNPTGVATERHSE
jgi:hypothetical protein